MQTFLLNTDFEITARQLDNQRLGKQRVEAMQILKALLNPDYGWQNHPAVNMWRGYEWALWDYANVICDEWTARGYKDNCKERINELMTDIEIVGLATNPPWLTEEFASNHRSVMLGKVWEKRVQAYQEYELDRSDKTKKKLDKAKQQLRWYQQFDWTETPVKRVNDKWPYLWPEVA